MKESVIKNCDLRDLKGDIFTEKMRPARNILINLRGCSVILKMTKKSYLVIKIEPCISKPRRPIGIEGRYRKYFFNLLKSFITIDYNWVSQR